MNKALHPTHRYVLLQQGQPVLTTNDCEDLYDYLIGRDVNDQYVALDYETPYPLLPYPLGTPDLSIWIEPLRQAAWEKNPWLKKEGI